ncbi:MAG: hypothetical protein JW719_00165 [Pirellulales bacterium]|nr:hypothetical protein [Pirellulales bacterium]
MIINLIASTVTAKGLRIKAELDPKTYPLEIKVTDDELAAVNIHPASFHGDWNHRVLPQHRKKQPTYFVRVPYTLISPCRRRPNDRST